MELIRYNFDADRRAMFVGNAALMAVERGNVKRVRGPWLRPLLQGILCCGERGYLQRTRQRETITSAADDQRWRGWLCGNLLLVCRHAGHGSSEAPRIRMVIPRRFMTLCAPARTARKAIIPSDPFPASWERPQSPICA